MCAYGEESLTVALFAEEEREIADERTLGRPGDRIDRAHERRPLPGDVGDEEEQGAGNHDRQHALDYHAALSLCK